MADCAAVVSYVAEVAGGIPFTLVDVGCSRGIHSAWRQLGRRLRAVAIDPNLAEIERLRKAETHPGVRYVAAYAGLPREHAFLKKKNGRPDCHRHPWHRLSAAKSLEKLKSRPLSTSDLTALNLWSETRLAEATQVIVMPDYLHDIGVDSVDFLKIDIDGKDFDVLNSFDSALDTFGILGLQLEVNFFGSEIETDHTFHNTDRFLKARGFELLDLTEIRRYSLAALPSRYLLEFPAQTEFGRILQTDALYFRDLGFAEHRQVAERLGPEKLLNLVCLFSVFNLPDCAADIVLQFRTRLSSLCDTERVLDLLAEQIQGPDGRHLSYQKWMESFRAQDERFFPARSRGSVQKSSQDGSWLATMVRRVVRRVAGGSGIKD